MLRQRQSRPSRKPGSTDGSKKLPSHGMFAGGTVLHGVLQVLLQNTSRSALIFARCCGSANRKSPTETVAGFPLRIQSRACEKAGKIEMRTSSLESSIGP